MKLRSVVFWLLLGALAVIGVLHKEDIRSGFHQLRALRWEWLAAAAAAQTLTYLTTAWALQGFLATLGFRQSLRRLWQSVVAFVLGLQTVPTAGVGGLMLWSAGLSQLSIPREAAIASGILYAVLDYVALFVLLAAGVVALLLVHSLHAALVVPLVVMSALILTAAIATGGLLLREQRGLAAADWITSSGNRILAKLRRAPMDAERIRATVGLFYADCRTLGLHWHSVVVPALWVLSARLLDVLTLQVLFAATGHPMAWGALAVGFVYANFASVVSVLPTGLGVLDASLALLFAGLGAPLAEAVVVTLLFRFLAYWLPIPYGLFVYHKITHAHGLGSLARPGVVDGT